VLTQEVTHRLGTSYHLSSNEDVQSQVLHVQQQDGKGGTISIQVRATGTGIYQFTPEQMQHLKHLIAGKSRAQATHLLLAQPGVSTVSVEITGRETEMMPGEASTIALLVIAPAA
jgi:VCBS repeat-containing protein